jgi:hypothetical protein
LIESINKTTDFIVTNYLLIFGVYSILIFLFRTFRKDKSELSQFDKSAVNLTLWIGTVWIALKIIGIILFLLQLKKESEAEAFSQHLSGFIENIWFQILFWIIISQLLRFKFFNSYLIPRILISFFFAFSFERINMILINFHRDYIPKGHSFNFDFAQLLLDLMLKTLIFIVIISAFHFGKRGIKNVLQHRI